MGRLIDDDHLRGYLAETLPATEMARIEKLLRDSADLRDQLDRLRLSQADTSLHTLGAIWRRSRITCASRDTLRDYLRQVLKRDHHEYIRFHLEVIECPYCLANEADLRRKALAEPGTPAEQDRDRGRKIFDSSRGLLKGDL